MASTSAPTSATKCTSKRHTAHRNTAHRSTASQHNTQQTIVEAIIMVEETSQILRHPSTEQRNVEIAVGSRHANAGVAKLNRNEARERARTQREKREPYGS